MGEPLAKLWLFASVSGTNTTPTEENKYKKQLSGGTPCKIPVVIFSCDTFVGLPREAKRGFKRNRARWDNPLQNSGCSHWLVELISRRPKKLNIKKSSVGKPLAKFRLLSSVLPSLLNCLRRPIAANWIRFL